MPENAYEAERACIISQNRQVMQEMGLLEAAGDLCALMRPNTKCTGVKPPYKRKVAQQASRASRRIKGMEAEMRPEDEEEYMQEAAEVRPLSQYELSATTYTAPFTIASSGVTVLQLGKVYRGPGQRHYWLSHYACCRHAFPVGYVASKVVCGHSWRMSIAAGDDGPVFTVVDEAAGVGYSGKSASAVWASARQPGTMRQGYELYGFQELTVQRAIAAQYTAAELSYSQHTDAPPPWRWTAESAAAGQGRTKIAEAAIGEAAPSLASAAAVAAVHSRPTAAPAAPSSASKGAPADQVKSPQCGRLAPAYATAASAPGQAVEYSHGPAASTAAQVSKGPQRSPLPPLRWLTPVELFAKELQLSVRGMCAATAAALASTTALGGVRHSSLAGLKQWLAAGEGHEELLRDFLHEGSAKLATATGCHGGTAAALPQLGWHLDGISRDLAAA